MLSMSSVSRTPYAAFVRPNARGSAGSFYRGVGAGGRRGNGHVYPT